MWTAENRPKYNRDHLKYPSDVTDEEWAVIGPLIPPAKRGGGKRRVDMRAVTNGVMYILSTGCQWRAIPRDLAPRSTIFGYLTLWNWDGTLDLIHDTLYKMCREQAGKEAEPTAGVIDSQSVKSAEKGGASIDPHGFDAGKLIKGKKRHILVDTTGLVLVSMIHSAGIQDRDGGLLLLATLCCMFPKLQTLFADSAYGGPIFATGAKKLLPELNVEVIRRCDQTEGFTVLPKRWIVERTIAWLNRCRRLAKDWENLNRNALAFLKLASIRLMLRKLCNP
jgi:putative transposase